MEQWHLARTQSPPDSSPSTSGSLRQVVISCLKGMEYSEVLTHYSPAPSGKCITSLSHRSCITQLKSGCLLRCEQTLVTCYLFTVIDVIILWVYLDTYQSVLKRSVFELWLLCPRSSSCFELAERLGRKKISSSCDSQVDKRCSHCSQVTVQHCSGTATCSDFICSNSFSWYMVTSDTWHKISSYGAFKINAVLKWRWFLKLSASNTVMAKHLQLQFEPNNWSFGK